MISLICAWINGWVNNGEAGDLRRYRVHYDVTLMRVCDSNNNAEDVGLPFDLTHWGRDNMFAILQSAFYKHVHEWKFILI